MPSQDLGEESQACTCFKSTSFSSHDKSSLAVTPQKVSLLILYAATRPGQQYYAEIRGRCSSMPKLGLQAYKFPGGEFQSIITRTTLPPRALAYSPSGSTLAVAGDNDNIKLMNTSGNKVSSVSEPLRR